MMPELHGEKHLSVYTKSNIEEHKSATKETPLADKETIQLNESQCHTQVKEVRTYR